MTRDAVAGGHAQGLLPAGERRRSAHVEDARPVLRGLAGLPRRARPVLGLALRGRGERVARRRGVAQRRPRRDLGALERGPRLRRGQRAAALEGLGPDARRTGACSPAARAAGCSRAATARRRGRCSARSTASPGATPGTSRRTSRPAISACRALLPHPDDASRFWAVIQGFGIFETTDDGALVDAAQPRPARRLAAREPRGRLLRAQARDVAESTTERLYQQNHVGMHRSDDAGRSWTEITDGLPTEFGFAAAGASARPRQLLRDPARPRPRPHACRTARPPSGARRTPARAGAGSDRGLPQEDAHLGVLREGMAIDSYDVPGLYFGTSTGPGVRERRRGRELGRDRELPARDLLGRGGGDRVAMAEVHLPATLPPLFRDLPRRVERRGGDGRRARSPSSTRAGPGCATGCACPGPALRPHVNVYVDQERAGTRDGARRAVAAST